MPDSGSITATVDAGSDLEVITWATPSPRARSTTKAAPPAARSPPSASTPTVFHMLVVVVIASSSRRAGAATESQVVEEVVRLGRHEVELAGQAGRDAVEAAAADAERDRRRRHLRRGPLLQ